MSGKAANVLTSGSRQSRLYLSSKIVSMIRSNDENGLFSAQELLHIESSLRDEFVRHQWLFDVCSAIDANGVVVTDEDIRLTDLRHSDEEMNVSKDKVEVLRTELKILNQQLNVLTSQRNELQNKLKSLDNQLIKSRTESEEQIERQKTRFNLQLNEFLDILKRETAVKSLYRDPKVVAQEIFDTLNSKQDKDISNWFEQQLREMSLNCADSEVLDAFNDQMFERLERFKDSLIKLHQECNRIKKYYVSVSEELSRKADLNEVLHQIQRMQENRNKMEIRECKPVNKFDELIPDMKFVENINADIIAEDFDEFQSLTKALNERVEVLQQMKNE